MDQDLSIRLLHADDDRGAHLMLRHLVSDMAGVQAQVDWVDSPAETAAALARAEHDVYVLDYDLEGKSSLDLLRAAREGGLTAPVIVFTGWESEDVDREALDAGADDTLIKTKADARALER